MIGGGLATALADDGHDIIRLTKSATSSPHTISWNSCSHSIMKNRQMEGLDAVVHLAGEPIFGRWTDKKKESIRSSRVHGTERLARSLAALRTPPKVLISGSAIGIYGDTGDCEANEESLLGNGFLAEVCKDWEAATQPAADAGIRVVQMRLGVVLHPNGGILRKILPSFRVGLCGPMGSGRQFMSWITLSDTVRAIRYSIQEPSLCGPVNFSAPGAVTNREFTRILATVLSRPNLVPMPAFALRILFGEMGNQTMLASNRVRPQRLLDAGFLFQHSTLERALHHLLAEGKTTS